VRLAESEGRILLTRDRRLLRDLRPVRALEVRSDDPLEQLRGVVSALAITGPAAPFTRCLPCNAELSTPVAPVEAERLLPPAARGSPGPVRVCPRCGRVYWIGSHVRRMQQALDRVLPGWLRVPDA
jgi:uncharacterized protein with PIN domain